MRKAQLADGDTVYAVVPCCAEAGRVARVADDGTVYVMFPCAVAHEAYASPNFQRGLLQLRTEKQHAHVEGNKALLLALDCGGSLLAVQRLLLSAPASQLYGANAHLTEAAAALARAAIALRDHTKG